MEAAFSLANTMQFGDAVVWTSGSTIAEYEITSSDNTSFVSSIVSPYCTGHICDR